MTGSMTMMLSNSAADLEAALQAAEDFGQREGSGSAARAGFYYTLTEQSKDKRLDVSNDAQCWDRFHRGASNGSSMIGGLKLGTKPEDTRKVRISECRQFLKLGGLPYVDGVEVLGRAMKIIKQAKIDGRLKSKPTDAMLSVARAQNNDPNNPLEDETIEIVIQPKEGKDKVEADALEGVRLRLEAIIKRFGESDETNDAVGYVQKRIDDLGGTSRAKKAAKRVKK
jgi:hypothetical protein